MDTKAAAREIVAEAFDPLDEWRHDRAILKTTARLDIPLRDPQETLHILRYLAEELPNICLLIEGQATRLDQQIMAQQRLALARSRIMRRKPGK